jgi:penicillin amidase
MIGYLENWDFIMDKDEVAPLIYAKWLQTFINETFNDDWENIDAPFIMPMLNQFEYLIIQNTSHPWFDDVGTPETETVDDIILRAMENVLEFFSDKYGDDTSKWTYGRYHKSLFWHPTELPALSYGPIASSGSWTTLNPAADRRFDWENPDPFIAKSGASQRLVVDLGNVSHTISVIPGGQRGWAISKHYVDQLKMHIEGLYHPAWFYATPSEFLPHLIDSTLILKEE